MENQTTHHQDSITGSRRRHTRLVPEVEKEIEYKTAMFDEQAGVGLAA